MIFKSKLKTLCLISIFSLFVSLFLTIFQTASFAREFYRVKLFKKEIEKLDKEGKEMEVEFSNSNSLKNLEANLKEFERIKEVKYIKIPSGWIVER